MTTPLYFSWNDNIRVVYGASRAAIYDFKTGHVFSLNEAARRLVEQVNQGQPIDKIRPDPLTFLHQLIELKLGYFSPLPQKDMDNTAETAPPAPLQFLWLELIEDCNLRCVHCYADSGPRRCGPSGGVTIQDIPLLDSSAQQQSRGPAPGMTEADWVNVIRQAANLGCQRLQFIGGEPFLYKPLFRLIDEARNAGFSFIEIFTNGTLLTERMVHILSEMRVRIAVSLHGSRPEVQDLIAGQSGAFEQAYRGLQLLQKFQVPTRLATTVLEGNQEEVEAIAKLVEELNLDNYHYDIVRPVGRGKEEALGPIKDDIVRSKWLIEPDFVTSYDSYRHNKWWHPCWSGKVAVQSQGQVIPCVFGRDQVVGNVLDSPLTDILAGERLQKLWGLTKDQIEICQECEYRYACGDCRPLALGETGNLYAKYPRCTYDPYSGSWRSIDGLEDKTASRSEAGPIISLATKDISSHPERHQILFRCAPDG